MDRKTDPTASERFALKPTKRATSDVQYSMPGVIDSTRPSPALSRPPLPGQGED
jgi:hypothetical protein